VKSRSDGGPVNHEYEWLPDKDECGGGGRVQEGMSVRELYAGQLAAALISNLKLPLQEKDKEGNLILTKHAKLAVSASVLLADELLHQLGYPTDAEVKAEHDRVCASIRQEEEEGQKNLII
jgi:hypothetical protein